MLLVHHSRDACAATPFAEAAQLAGRVPLIKVDGVDEKPSDRSCFSGTNHWLVGNEKAAAEEVIKWLTDSPNVGARFDMDPYGLDVALRDIAAGEEITVDYHLVEGGRPDQTPPPNA